MQADLDRCCFFKIWLLPCSRLRLVAVASWATLKIEARIVMNKTCLMAAVGCAAMTLALAGTSQAAQRAAGKVVPARSIMDSSSTQV
jgi:hypothetical protein